LLLARGLPPAPLNLDLGCWRASALVSGAGAIFALVVAAPIANRARYPEAVPVGRVLSYMGYALPRGRPRVRLLASRTPLCTEPPLLVIAYVVMFCLRPQSLCGSVYCSSRRAWRRRADLGQGRAVS
jgi:hypothetical protein